MVKFKSFGKISIGKFWRYSNNFTKVSLHCRIKPVCKTSSICAAVSIQYRLVTDGQTDRQTQAPTQDYSCDARVKTAQTRKPWTMWPYRILI